MSSQEDKDRHQKRLKRNRIAKVLFDPNEFKGAYSLKIVKDKTKYKREKLTPRNIEVEEHIEDE